VQLPQLQTQDLVQRTDSAITDAAAMAVMQVSMGACQAYFELWLISVDKDGYARQILQ
jgi:hypothetical protein